MKTFSRNLFLFFVLIIFHSTDSFAQVTIGSLEEPISSALLELKIEGNNKGMLFPKVQLKSNLDMQTIANPATGLMIYNTNNSDPSLVSEENKVKKDKFYYWADNRWQEIAGIQTVYTILSSTLIQQEMARPAIFSLDGKTRVYNNQFSEMLGVLDLFKNYPVNTPQNIPLREVVNFTNEHVIFKRTANSDESTIILKPGMYQFVFVYEFLPANTVSGGNYIPPACSLSPYFMDFPSGSKDSYGRPILIRMNSNCTHIGEYWANHGNTINYVASIEEEIEWTINFGIGDATYTDGKVCVRRQGSQTVGEEGFIMNNTSTFLYILRLGD